MEKVGRVCRTEVTRAWAEAGSPKVWSRQLRVVVYGTRGIIWEVMKGEDGGVGRAQMIKSKEIEN